MQFNVFDDQYDQADLRLIPFEQTHHQNSQLILTVHARSPELSEVKRCAKELADAFRAPLIVIRSYDERFLHHPYLEMSTKSKGDRL